MATVLNPTGVRALAETLHEQAFDPQREGGMVAEIQDQLSDGAMIFAHARQIADQGTGAPVVLMIVDREAAQHERTEHVLASCAQLSTLSQEHIKQAVAAMTREMSAEQAAKLLRALMAIFQTLSTVIVQESELNASQAKELLAAVRAAAPEQEALETYLTTVSEHLQAAAPEVAAREARRLAATQQFLQHNPLP